MTEAGGGWRGRWLVVAALMAGVLSALTVVLALAAPQRSIPHRETNLSQATTLSSDLTSIAISPDGDRVAVVWVEETSIGSTIGSVWLRWASESSVSGWSPRVPVFAGTEQAGARWSAQVAVTGTVAHVVYTVWGFSAGDPAWTVISYTTCLLTDGGGCGAAQTIVSIPYSAPPVDQILYGADIALDNGGNPHFVYGRVLKGTDSETSTVYYREGVLGVDEQLPDNIDGRDPAIAWSDGYAHVVWEEGKAGGAAFEIMYNRRDITGTWQSQSEHLASGMGTAIKHPRNPDVAAYEDHVVVMWDWQWTVEADQYALAYTRYLTDTDQWIYAYEVGTQGMAEKLIGEDALRDTLYYTHTSTAEIGEEWVGRRYLQPSVALDQEGLPTVVWHANNGTYDIMYSRAQSVTQTGNKIFSWSEPAVLHLFRSGESAGPSVAQAPVVSSTLHVAYSHDKGGGDRETYYVGREAGYTPIDLVDVFLPVVLRNGYNSGPG